MTSRAAQAVHHAALRLVAAALSLLAVEAEAARRLSFLKKLQRRGDGVVLRRGRFLQAACPTPHHRTLYGFSVLFVTLGIVKLRDRGPVFFTEVDIRYQ